MNPDDEEQLVQQEQATASALEEQPWWVDGEPWHRQPMDKLREWHRDQWASIGYPSGFRRYK